ncbi:hypothetical protein L9F63_014913, partial [Diploptera punctata]
MVSYNINFSRNINLILQEREGQHLFLSPHYNLMSLDVICRQPRTSFRYSALV